MAVICWKQDKRGLSVKIIVKDIGVGRLVI